MIKLLLDRAGRFLKLGVLPAVYTLMLLVIFILPFYSLAEYSIFKNTTSHLGAQFAPYAWVMNLTFALLGIATIIDGWIHLTSYWFHKAVLVVFGVSLIMTAFFQHAPIVPGVPFSTLEDSLHSVGASVTGFSFTVFAAGAAFIESTKPRKLFAAGMAGVAIVLSLLIFNVADLAGIWQRSMFILAFAWLMYFLYTPEVKSRRQISPQL